MNNDTHRSILKRGLKTCMFIGLNPALYDKNENNEKTIRICHDFALRKQFQKLIMVNLFSYRSASRAGLLGRAKEDLIPVKHRAIRSSAILKAQNTGIVIAAWGANPENWTEGTKQDREKLQCLYKKQVDEIKELMGEYTLYCLAKNADGSPHHPLYVETNKCLKEW